MTITVRDILETIDRLPEADRRVLEVEILRRTSGQAPTPIKDEAPILVPPSAQAHEEWVRRLRQAASHCGPGTENLDWSREGIYED